jgi:hypothetical protein
VVAGEILETPSLKRNRSKRSEILELLSLKRNRGKSFHRSSHAPRIRAPVSIEPHSDDPRIVPEGTQPPVILTLHNGPGSPPYNPVGGLDCERRRA